jgi:hypothetical protein
LALINKQANGKCVAFFSTYPPRDCGIASFTKDLANEINLNQSHSFTPKVIAINDQVEISNYDNLVKWYIDCNSPDDYKRLAKDINESEVKLVNVQHEFGIFGGNFGEYVTNFYEQIRSQS